MQKRQLVNSMRIKPSAVKKLKRYLDSGTLFSRSLGRQGPAIEKLLGRCARKVRADLFQDDLKAPLGCEAKPAKIVPSAFNVYVGENVEKTKDPATIIRAAYAFGSGVASIGLNPKTMRLYPFWPDLVTLANHVTKVIHSRQEWKDQMQGQRFNVCSIKIYYWVTRVSTNGEKYRVRKCVKWHVDVERNVKGEPKTNNSQVPDTPVAIVTYGSEKHFTMRRHKTKSVHRATSQIWYRQESGTLIVLDPRDEEIRDGLHWRHMSQAGDDRNGVTFSFLFRICKKRVRRRSTLRPRTLKSRPRPAHSSHALNI